MCLRQVSQSIRVIGENRLAGSHGLRLCGVIAFGSTISWIEVVTICTLFWAEGFVCLRVRLVRIAVRCVFVLECTACVFRPQIRDCDEMVLFDPS